MAEAPKRLAPTRDTLRDLAAHSGNVCAFRDGTRRCEHAIIDGGGRLIAQLCHIEAAEPRGERFNPAMTNAQRRHRDNLLFMCLRHHIETNDVALWPVDRMKQMKADHEAQFQDKQFVISELAIHDISKALKPGRPQTLSRFGAYINRPIRDPADRITPEQFSADIARLIDPLIDRLRKLAPDTRSLLGIVIERAESFGDDLGVPATEIEQVTGMGPRRIQKHVSTMERYHVAVLDEHDYGDWWIATYSLDGWPFWRDVKAYCEENGIEVSDIVVNLRFDLLD